MSATDMQQSKLMKIEILPSLFASDPGHLADAAEAAERSGADELHLDIMDGHFVPNLSMGPDVVKMSRRVVGIPLNVHLMLTHPDKYIEKFAEAGSDVLHIHVEADCDIAAAIREIKERGIRPGVTLNPDTAAEDTFCFLENVSEILVMSVHPGYSGQKFISGVLPKIRAIRNRAKAIGKPDLDIMVDGGINFETACECAKHGANKFVAGNFLYSAPDMTSTLLELRRTIIESFIH